MKHFIKQPHRPVVAGLLIVFALILAACSSTASNATQTGGNSSGAVPVTGNGVVKIANDPKLGQILVNANGMTLYTNTVDTADHLRCVDPNCTNFWKPQTLSGQPSATGNIMGTLGTVKRPDGSTQVTYNQQPLYTFYLDKQPGDVKGEGFTDFGGTWHAVKLGAAPSSGTSAPASTQAAPAGGGYQYP